MSDPTLDVKIVLIGERHAITINYSKLHFLDLAQNSMISANQYIDKIGLMLDSRKSTNVNQDLERAYVRFIGMMRTYCAELVFGIEPTDIIVGWAFRKASWSKSNPTYAGNVNHARGVKYIDDRDLHDIARYVVSRCAGQPEQFYQKSAYFRILKEQT